MESGESDKEIDNNIENMIVAVYEGEIIGIAILLENLLHLIMIKYSYQGYGLGGAFLKYVEEELFKNHKTIRLETFEGNIATIEFYKKHDWKIVEKEAIDLQVVILLNLKNKDKILSGEWYWFSQCKRWLV